MKCGIVGYGIIGKATHLGLLNNRSIFVHDVGLGTELSILKDCDVVFYCIPTTNQKDVDTLLDITVRLHAVNPTLKSVYRSTVPVGICRHVKETHNISVYYMPEFLRERHWQTECYNKDMIVGQEIDVDWSEIFPDKRFISCTWEEAEITKMFGNNLNAMKTVFANHFYDLSQTVGADYNKVLELWAATSNDQTYLDASPNLRGFGGKCLPKDLDFVIDTFKTKHITQTLFDAVLEDNKKWPTTKKS